MSNSKQPSFPGTWALAKVIDVAEVLRGVTYKKEDSSLEPKYGNVPILRATNIGQRLSFDELVWVPRTAVSSEQFLRPGDIVLAASSGSLSVVGKAAILQHEWLGAFGAFCMVVRPRSAFILPRFLAYYFQTSGYRRRVSELAAGVNINNLRREHIESTSFPLPSRVEQARIVAVLDAELTRLDAAVAALERVRTNLKRYRASVLKAAVEGRLVPTEAELARKEGRDFEPASLLLDRILVERRRRWEESELDRMKAAGKPPKDDRWKSKYKEPVAPDTSTLSRLPDGWSWTTVDQISFDVRYGSSAKADEDSTGVPTLRMGNIVNAGLDFADLKYLQPDHWEFPDLLLQTGDLLFNRTNSAELVGKSAVFKTHSVPCSFASYLIRVRLWTECSPDYLCFFLNSFHGRRWIASVVSQQVGQANVNGTKLKNCAIPLPPKAEQHRIVSEVERLASVVQEATRGTSSAVARSARLRQSILKWAFEGRLVDQDPDDEPASVLLDRIRAERAATTPAAKSRKTNAHHIEAAK